MVLNVCLQTSVVSFKSEAKYVYNFKLVSALYKVCI
jgi:hypothetical protein